MLVNFEENGRVRWYNLYLSKEAAQSCLAEDTIWLEGGLPPYPTEQEGYVPCLYLREGNVLAYEYEESPLPVYTDTELLMQRMTDLELLLLSIQMGGGVNV